MLVRPTKVDLVRRIHQVDIDGGNIRRIIVKAGFVKHRTLGVVRLVARFLGEAGEVAAEAVDAVPGEDAEEFSLMVVKLRRRFSTESKDLFTQESGNSGER